MPMQIPVLSTGHPETVAVPSHPGVSWQDLQGSVTEVQEDSRVLAELLNVVGSSWEA